MLNSKILRFLVRSVLTTLLTANLTLKLAAHDHPRFDLESSPITTSCFVDGSEAVQAARPSKFAWQLPGSDIALWQSALNRAWRSAKNGSVATIAGRVVAKIAAEMQMGTFRETASLVVHSPEPGFPPSPIRLAKKRTPERNLRFSLEENYLPYDLSVRDWRFGSNCWDESTFKPARVGEAQTPADTSPVESALTEAREVRFFSAARLALDAIAKADELVRNRVIEVSQTLRTSIDWEQSWQQGLRYIEKSKSQFWTAVEVSNRQLFPQPLYTEPTLVVFEDSDGRTFILPREQAERWDWVGTRGQRKVSEKEIRVHFGKLARGVADSLPSIYERAAAHWQALRVAVDAAFPFDFVRIALSQRDGETF